MEIPVELVRILINEGGETQVIVVREVDGDRELPISIGFFEAAAIDRRLKEIPIPRPMTHELIENVIEALGVHIDVPPEAIARCIGEVGIGFLYAPLLHDAMRYVVHARREMRIRTVFNLLGPVCNPAGANAQIVGVYNEDLTDIMAQVLCELGTRRAFVVHGSDGLDEITVSGETKISEVRNGEVRTYYIAPEHFGIGRAPTSELLGGDARQNAEVVRGVLSGAQGPKTDVVLLNAAAGLVAGGMSETLQEGIALARESIRSGRALQCLNRLAALTGELAPRSG